MALTKLNNQSLTNVTAAGLPTLTSDNMPTGSVLQVVQGTTYTSNFSENTWFLGRAHVWAQLRAHRF